jgi:acetyl-CoA acetyltransferase
MSNLPPSGEPAIRTIAMPADTKASSDIFGGWLMSQMDLAGGSAASRRAGERLKIGGFDIVEFNEAYASQSLAVLRGLGLPDDAEHVNPNGGAIALGHPLGMSDARLVLTALHQLEKKERRQTGACNALRRRRPGVSLTIERL